MQVFNKLFAYLENKASHWPVLYLVLLALGVRFLFNITIFGNEQLALQTDSLGYLTLGASLKDGFTFPSILRTPGYPFFISLVWWISFSKSIIAVVMAQIILDSTVPLIISRTKNFFKQDIRENKFGALLYALNPLAIYYSGKIMSECVFIFLMALSLYFVKKYFWEEEGNHAYLIPVVLTISLCILTRPIALGFYILLMGFLLWKSLPQIRRLVSISAFGVAIILLSWAIRNEIIHDEFTLSTIGNYNLYIFGQNSYAAAHHLDYQTAEEVLKREFNHPNSSNIRWRESHKAREFGIKLIKENFGSFVQSALLGVVKTAFQPPWGVSQLNQQFYDNKHFLKEGGGMTNMNLRSFLNFPYIKRLGKLPIFTQVLWLYGLVYLFVIYTYGYQKLRIISEKGMKIFYLLSVIFFLIIPGPIGFSRFRINFEVLLLN